MKVLYKTWRHKTRKGREKQKQLEATTGLKWDFFSTGAGMHFTPVITSATPTDAETAAILLPHLTRWGAGFVKLAETTGMPLADVLIAAKTLVRSGAGICRVNRMGNFSAIAKN